MKGLDFIISHFEEPSWPRRISTHSTNNAQITVNSRKEAIGYFKNANYMDCRISAFSESEKELVKPNLIFVDLDNRKALKESLILFHKTIGARPTVLDTGKGYAIIQPINMTSWNDKKIIFYKKKQPKELARMFLQWVERYLTNYKCDSGNYPSLNNTMIRIPYTYNTKLLDQGKSEEESKVHVAYAWDKFRVTIENIRPAFIAHLEKTILSKQKRNHISGHPNPKKFKWIEEIMRIKINDGRERLLFDVTRYLLNIRGNSIENTTSQIYSWLDSRYYEESRIKNHCFRALKDKKYPRKLETIRNSDVDLYKIIVGVIKN